MQCADRTSRFVRDFITAALIVMVLAGCQSEPIRVSPLTPTVLTVQVTPALLALENEFRSCANELEGTGLVLLERSTPAIDLSQSNLALRWGNDGAWRPGDLSSAAVIGHETLVIVANAANPIESISQADLQAIYAGTIHNWPGGNAAVEIQPWTYTPGEDVQEIFQAALGISSAVGVAYLAPDPSAMREAIGTNLNAIGYLPAQWVDSTVKALEVDSVDSNLLSRPLLAWSQSEPTRNEKTWLLCLQERLDESMRGVP